MVRLEPSTMNGNQRGINLLQQTDPDAWEFDVWLSLRDAEALLRKLPSAIKAARRLKLDSQLKGKKC